MKFTERYDRIPTGLISGLLLPLIIGFFMYLFAPGEMSIGAYVSKLIDSDIVTHSITLSVFPNIIIFLIFNRFDMLRASQGVLAITIVWAIIVFGVKFLL